jgi:hypothetical protein
MIRHVALVSETDELSLGELAQEATVNAFARLEDVPVGYWRAIVADTIDGPRIGFHRSRDGQPYVMILMREDWATTSSHEILELLVDPSGDQVVAGESPDPAQGRVEFLLEICDPCADPELGYPVNGIRLSDFCTPQYHDPVAAPGVRYSFTGSIPGPRAVNPGGYLTWRLPGTAEWFIAARNDTLRILRVPAPVTGASLRESIDRHTRAAVRPRGKARRTRRLKADQARYQQAATARAARAAQLREEIAIAARPT